MEQVIRIFLADPSRDFRELLRTELEQQKDLLVVGSAADGAEAYARISAQNPDVLVTELLLPELDGLGLLRRLKDEGRLPHTVVVSGFVNDHIAQAVSRLGVEDYLPKPCAVSELVCRIRETVDPDFRRPFRDYNHTIRQALLRFGIMPNLHGYAYLQEGIRRVLEGGNVLQGITKILYPDLAKHFGTTAVCVERSIRGAILKAWNRGTPEKRRNQFHGIFDGFDEAPSNTRFIDTMAEYIEIECERADIRRNK